MLYSDTKFGVDRGVLFFALLLVLSSIAHLNFSIFQDSAIADAFLLLLISVLLIIHFLKSHRLSPFKLPELAFLLLVGYVIFKNILGSTFDVSSISYFIFFAILYSGLKTYFTEKNISSYSLILLISTGIILSIYLVVAIYHCYFLNETLTNFFFPNKSIFSILLASQIVFLIPIILFNKKYKTLSNFSICFFIGLITASLILLLFTRGRSGCIGLILALAYVGYQYLSSSRVKRIVLYSLFAFSVFLIVGMFSYKSDSSSGRLLIYKVSAGMLKDNWLWGIGHGQFKIQYNQYQAAHFATHNINSKEALLADNTFFAFNDFLQAIIENGLITFFFLSSIIFLLVLQIKKAITNSNNKHLFIASVASLISILTGSFFSYPLQILPIAIQATLCLCIINTFHSEKRIQIELPEMGKKIAKGMLILLSTLLIIHFVFYFNYKRENHRAFELKRAGFRQQAIEKYKYLSSSYIQEGNMLYLYAQELYYVNQLTQAREKLNRAKKFYCAHELYKLSAAIESELKNYKQAEADYKTAINMVPNRMVSRSELFEFYLERKDTTSAMYWANSILNMPVKVASQRTKNIQQKVWIILEGLKNLDQ